MNSIPRALRYWLPVVVWLGFIVLESTDLMSASHTGSLLLGLATALFGHIDPQRFEIFHHVLRKTGHFLGYGVLCMLFLRALRGTTAAALGRLALFALAFTCLVASLDEWHQTLLPNRTGRVLDVVLDTVGAACFQIIFVLLLRRRGAGETPPGAAAD